MNAVRERVGDMCLVHGGDMKGVERIAASWVEQHGVQQLRFGLDRKLGDRAGFRRNEEMLSLKPHYVIAFQGNGVTERRDQREEGRHPSGRPPRAARYAAGRLGLAVRSPHRLSRRLAGGLTSNTDADRAISFADCSTAFRLARRGRYLRSHPGE